VAPIATSDGFRKSSTPSYVLNDAYALLKASGATEIELHITRKQCALLSCKYHKARDLASNLFRGIQPVIRMPRPPEAEHFYRVALSNALLDADNIVRQPCD